MLEQLPEKELLALMMFSYMMQMDNPLTIVGSDTESFNDYRKIKKTLYIGKGGIISNTKVDLIIFSFELVIDVELLHASVQDMLEQNPLATEEQIGLYSFDAFLLQITPQWWEQSQNFNGKLSSNCKGKWLKLLRCYSKDCGYSAENIYEKLFLPMLSLLYKKRKLSH